MGTFFLILFVLLVGIWVGFVLGFSRALRGAARRIHGTKPPVFAKLIVGIGCVALVAALATSLYTWHFTLTAQRTSGTVTEMREQTEKDSGSISFAPTFRFRDASGAEHIITSSGFSSTYKFHIGDRVDVLYRANSPESGCIDSYWQVWGLPSVLAILGSLELIAGLVVFSWLKIIGRFRRQTLKCES